MLFNAGNAKAISPLLSEHYDDVLSKQVNVAAKIAKAAKL